MLILPTLIAPDAAVMDTSPPAVGEFESIPRVVILPASTESAEIVSTPPAVWMVLVVSSIVNAPLVTVNVTELPSACFKSRTPSVRSLMVMLLLACSSILVVAAIPSSSDS